MTKTTSKRTHGPVLVAALTVLGASLGVSTPAGAAETTGLFLKGHDTTSTQHKGEVTSHAIKGEVTSHAIKGEVTSHAIKGETTSIQHKGQAPSAMFLKHNAVSTQIKGETTSTQHKIKSNQIKLDTPN